ncbi:uncharacterized protein BX663DRAFT_518315, partial [Cokeromyces recurvatus]|uniref:uncharacterized protein n=1 Tax=Cokeromyces recurvatus TaxID=90255 RepID=UPI002220229A
VSVVELFDGVLVNYPEEYLRPVHIILMYIFSRSHAIECLYMHTRLFLLRSINRSPILSL